MKQTVLKCSPVTVRLWRNRWKLFEGVTIQIEGEIDNETASKVGLLHKIKEILTDLPRAGSSSIITNPDKDRLIALACEPPKKYALPFTVWTHKELSAQAKRIEIGISSSYYGILKKKGLKPHKSEYWLFPKIENEEEFVARIEKLNELYAIANCPTNEIVISSPDEKTGIQAISHSQISKMEIGKPKRIEYQVEIDYSPGKSSLKLAIARFWS